MVKSVLGVAHQGFRDWVIQRLSAIFMAVYSLVFIFYIVMHPGLSFAEWHTLFSTMWMKVTTLIFLACLIAHAWIGMWTILTDYVKPFVISCIAQVSVFLMLSACFIWGVLILWSL